MLKNFGKSISFQSYCCNSNYELDVFRSSSNYFRERDKIYVCAEKNENSEWVVNNKVGWLVYEPNLLISCTTVVGKSVSKICVNWARKYRTANDDCSKCNNLNHSNHF
jgi:hypothetical protein